MFFSKNEKVKMSVKKNYQKVSVEIETLEVLFLILISFFSIFSFWITIPLSIILIVWCSRNIKRDYRRKFFKVILIFNFIIIYLSIVFQVVAIRLTGDWLIGFKESCSFIWWWERLSIYGGW